MAWFNGRNINSGIFHGRSIDLNRLIAGFTPGTRPTVYGYALTQSAFDALTPEAGLYYAIFDTAAGETIIEVTELTQAEYDALESYGAQTLYIIKDGNDITDVKLGETQVAVLYLGDSKEWEQNVLPSWIPENWDSYVTNPTKTSDYYAFYAAKTSGTSGMFFKVFSKNNDNIYLADNNNYLNIGRPTFNSATGAWAMFNQSTAQFTSSVTKQNTFDYLYASLAYSNAGGPVTEIVVLQHTKELVFTQTVHNPKITYYG